MNDLLEEKATAIRSWLSAAHVGSIAPPSDAVDLQFCREYVAATENHVHTAIEGLGQNAFPDDDRSTYQRLFELVKTIREAMVMLTRIAALRYWESAEILDGVKRLSAIQRQLIEMWPLPDDRLIERAKTELDRGQGIPLKDILDDL